MHSELLHKSKNNIEKVWKNILNIPEIKNAYA